MAKNTLLFFINQRLNVGSSCKATWSIYFLLTFYRSNLKRHFVNKLLVDDTKKKKKKKNEGLTLLNSVSLRLLLNFVLTFFASATAELRTRRFEGCLDRSKITGSGISNAQTKHDGEWRAG